MSRSRLSAAGPWAVFVFYLAVALEAIIMITPFTAYFYSVYAPVLEFLESHSSTAWLTSFFLPHISSSDDLFLTGLAYLGPVLLAAGLGIFLVCAFQVYSAKLLRRGVVTKGLYRQVRHPQYLGLAIAGLGLLLYWPRFIILVLYIVMLFLYYVLARDEERRMTLRHGAAYETYARSMPMFVPGSPGRRLADRMSGRRPARAVAVTAVFGATLLLSLAAAFVLRSYSESRLITLNAGNILAISLSGGDENALKRRLDTALGDPGVRHRLAAHPPEHTLVAYVVPQQYMMQHLIADLGEHEAHHGGGDNGGMMSALKHLGEMYALRPLRQLRTGAASPGQRVIFTEARTPADEAVPLHRALAPGVLRYPLFFTDIEENRVTMSMDVPPRHTWGTIPVPAF